MKYIGTAIVFLAALVAVKGGTWDNSKQGFKKLTITGHMTIVLAILGLITSTLTTYQMDEESETKSKQLDAAVGNTAEAKDTVKLLHTEISALRNQLDPFIAIANTKYPGINSDLALKQLATEVSELSQQTKRLKERTEGIETRDRFTPLSQSTQETIVRRLADIAVKYSRRKIEISVSSDIGSRNRQLVAQELCDIFRTANISVKGPEHVMTFPAQGSTLKVAEFVLNPTDMDVANDIAQALDPFIKVRHGKKDEKLESGKLKISFHGEPQFSKDGSVSFK